MEPAMPAIPIVILAFNRPEYLTAVLSSLVQQASVDLSKRDVFLFQDGAVNPFSSLTHCDPAAPAANVEIFKKFIPHGTPMLAPHNLGIALNFDRAERFVFEEFGADAAIFLEDDLVLGPYYLKTLEQLIGLALANERIAYVAAYGNHKAAAEEQLRQRSALTLLGHIWGAGLTRRQWLRQKQYVDQYLDIVRTADYRRRDHDRIIDLFHSWGLGVPGTSQDIAKTHAAILCGTVKVNTYACFGHYIGESGSHFNPAMFERMGFVGTAVMQEDIFGLVPPDDAVLTRFLDVARRSAMVEAVTKRVAAT
jgi:hypothetical protein